MHFNFTVSRKSFLLIGSAVAAGAVACLLWRNVFKPRFWNSRQEADRNELAQQNQHSRSVVRASSVVRSPVNSLFEKWKLHPEFSSFIPEEVLDIHEHKYIYGLVYKGRFGPTKRSVALKEFLFKTSNRNCQRQFFEELQLSVSLKHKFIVRTLAISSKCISNSIYLMQECMEGDIIDLLDRACVRGLNEKSAMFVMAGCVCALNYLHCHNVIHCDMKGTNILVDNRGYVKLADFGLSLFLGDQEYHEPSPYRGTLGFLAPEIMMGCSFNTQADIWSLGAAIYQLFHMRTPFGLNTRIPDEREYENLSFSARMTKQCEDLLRQMLRYNPEKRITTSKIYKSKYMKMKIQRVWRRSFPSPLLEILPEPCQRSCEW